MSSSMKQLLETMCGGDFMSKNPEEAMDFLNYVAEVSRGWDEPNKGEVGKMKSQPNALNAKAGMYTLNEDIDMKAKVEAMTRRLEELELKKIREVQAVSETPVQVMPCFICQSYKHLVEECPSIPAVREMFGDQANKPRALQYTQPGQASQQASNLDQAIVNLSKVVGDFVGDQKSINAQLNQRIDSVENTLNKKMNGMQNDLSQKIDNLQYSISRLTNHNIVHEKGRFPSQPHQNPKGIHEVEAHEENLHSIEASEGQHPIAGHDQTSADLCKIPEGLVTIKRGLNVNKKAFLTEQVSAIIQCKSPMKYKDPGCPTISVMIGGTVVEKALLDLGASVNLLPYSVYKQLGLGELKPTSITLSLVDRSVKIPRGMIEDVLVQVDNFYYPMDFFVLDTNPIVKETNYVPIILGRPFIATSNAIINFKNGLMQLMFGNMTLELNIFYMCKKPINPKEDEGPEEVCIIDTLVEEHCCRRIEEILPLFNEEEAQEAVKEEAPKLDLKPLPTELKYAYLEENKKCHVLTSSSLTTPQEECLLEVLRRCKKAIGWKISDLKGISLLVCTHHIYMEEEAKPICQPQRRLNPHMQEVVRAEVLKLLQVGIIYPISDSPWVSPTQVVPKKSGITVVQNHKGEEVATRLTSGWRVCIDYRKLNVVTRKDHFPLPFIDQVLERVSGHPFYCFLDGYSRRMPFGLCNAPTAFQRCILSIFSDMVERIMEVFMDDITIYGSTFEKCLVNLEAVLNRCIEKDLVLNWEKCHFMVQQGIVLGHIISKKGMKLIKQRRFIKDFSKLSKPLCELLGKDAKFLWDESCQKSFEQLKHFLTTAPIVRAPNWQLPFEVMCDANEFAIGAILGQRDDGKPYVIYYASKH
ncbi:Retrovirus-related Pol polyprotein from transposon 17.6 [Vitis vinifera]|uniref:Retrovirus-related Pol polyprotein from transposon 17.6 n=1 Tax=Vitis vinifera TaxID=29760 RepID=A0A438HRH7_VITVI|nr:Retrovirus-related Pol polyprotein from transposon 17.6 [Vitis vinifera]